MYEGMNPRAERAPIVVGVDSAGSATDAVDWAAAEAATQHCPLHVVHVYRPPTTATPYGAIPVPDAVFSAVHDAAKQVVRDAALRALAVAPDLAVSALLITGAPAPALVREAEAARLLVLGTHGLSGVRSRLTGSVSVTVSAQPHCPVVVIHTLPGIRASVPTPPRVVVGVDTAMANDRTRTDPDPAIGFAFHAARQRHIPLTALHACRPGSLAEIHVERAMARALARWQELYPDIPVTTKVVRDEPASALLSESHGAALLILGCHGPRHVLGRLHSSTSQTVLSQACSPLAIVNQHNWAALPAGTQAAYLTSAQHRSLRRRKRT
jgi:nucleotide-binding universal stress UspA family protein